MKPRFTRFRAEPIVRLVSSVAQREALVRVLSYWNRNQAVRIALFFTLAWVVGAVGIHLAERGGNPSFDTIGESFWSVWVILFSGIDDPPRTTLGRFFAMILLGTGVGLAGLFTGTVASVLVEHQLRRRDDLANFETEGHLVLCNWSPGGLAWIREVHSKIIQDKRPVVIIHDDTERIDLPDTQDEPAFQDVFIIKGDPTNEVILRRARVSKAYSVVVLVDDRQGEHADGKSILTCIAVRNICKGDSPNIAVECRNPNLRHHLLKAGADEVISSDELGLRLLARTALYHGITRVYTELLTVGRDANEMFLIPMPAELVGRDFVEIAGMFLRYRDDRRSCLLVGLQRGEEMVLNPIGNEAGPVREDDQLIVLSRSFVNPSQPLPTVPPVEPSRPGA